jgi:hypothetical protein
MMSQGDGDLLLSDSRGAISLSPFRIRSLLAWAVIEKGFPKFHNDESTNDPM